MTHNPKTTNTAASALERIPDWGYHTLLFTILFIVWKGVLSLSTVNWDDPEYILQNPYLIDPTGMLFDFYMGNYHPVTLLSLYLDSILFGTAYSKWHLSSLVLHSINALLLYQVVRAMGGKKSLSFLSVLLWSVLPVHTESIAWLSARKDLVYTGIGLGSVWMMLGYAKSDFNKHSVYSAALILFLMACLAKAMAVSIALWIPVILYPYFQNKGWKKALILLSPFLLMSLITGILAIMAQSDAGAIDAGIRTQSGILVSIESMGMLIAHIVYPFHLSPFYPYPEMIPGYGAFIFIITLGLAGLIGFKIPRLRPVLAGMLMFFACVLPVSQLLPVGSAITADRYAYAATAGLLIGCISVQQRKGFAGQIILVFVILIMAWRSMEQLRVWRNGTQVFEQVTKLYPEAAFAWNNLGNAYAEAGRLADARNAFQKSVAADSSYAPGLLNLAVVLRESGQNSAALALYQRIQESHSLYPKAAILALQLQAGSDPELPHLLSATGLLHRFPDNPEVWYVAGNIFQNAHRHAEAIVCYSQHLNFHPDFKDAILNRAISYTETGQIQSAIETFEKLLPDYSQPGILYANWAWALYKNQQYTEAIEKAEQSVRILPGIPQLWFNYGLIAAKAGQDSLASSVYEKGMQLSPDAAGLTQAKQDLEEAGIQAEKFLKRNS